MLLPSYCHHPWKLPIWPNGNPLGINHRGPQGVLHLLHRLANLRFKTHILGAEPCLPATQGRNENKGGHLYQHIMISVILIPNKGKNHPISCKNIIIPSWLDNQWPSRFTTMKFIINFIIARVMFWILFLICTTWDTYAPLLPSHQHTIRFIHN